ncbi:ABC transporter permease [Haloarchaeobius iranensis]|uniref:ABC-type transport system involved in multi-copper enzyme maturation, permease component n=1 Tax=Haloarchaeobius iranensis TaxID=996166 RepID=A0A1G9YP70_9EURY|nr:ABC transporter permease subunit [Haloarchaeobius iranensis]SDN10283.1 ABC-type transport system involved in multi-copper enzyme maturation, permease component [Haloarchaeobius iranensis]
MSELRYVADVAEREFRTVLRTPTLLAVGLGYVVLVGGIGWLGGTGAYLALVLDLLTPVELLVPVLSFAVGYRALLGDRESGELETIRTYPIAGHWYVVGVYLGRAVVVLGLVLLSFVLAGSVVPTSDTAQLSVVASHPTADSPALYLRYALATALFALVALAIATLVSAAARSTRGGLALATGGVVALVVGLDSALLGSVSGEHVPTAVLALSPNSAYRSLVLELSVAPTGVAVPEGPTALLGTAALLAWLAASLALATRLAWR